MVTFKSEYKGVEIKSFNAKMTKLEHLTWLNYIFMYW
jgi:hypothetical protein